MRSTAFPLNSKMKVLVSGASGLVGGQLIPALQHERCEVAKLVRHRVSGRSRNVPFDPERGTIDLERLAGQHAVVHLAGEPIANGRWTAERKRRIRESRARGTRLLAESLAEIPLKPKVLVCASAIGYYGNRGSEELTEDSAPGEGFLAEVCRDWEAATQPARDAGIRVVNLRLGMVLTTHGGALPKLLPLFRMGLGGPVGSGRQYMSWIGIQDVVNAIKFAIANPDLEGPVNVTAPEPVTNKEFAGILGRVMGRPAFFPTPAAGIRLALGQMGTELLLNGARVLPTKLEDMDFDFRFRDLEHALRILIQNKL